MTDDDGGVGSDTLVVTVANLPPQVDAGPDQTLNEGDTAGFAGSFTDPGTLDTHTFTWNFGDGSVEVSVTLTPSHTYAEDGVYTVTLTVTDDDGGIGADTLTVTVANLAPVVEAGPNQVVAQGETVDLAPASFTDAGVLDTHTALVDWGDGTTTVASVTQSNGGGTVDAGHVYATAGIFTVVVTVTDDEGATGADLFQVEVEGVANPEQTVFDLLALPKDRKIDLVWTPVNGADSYNIYRSQTPGGPYTLIAAGHVTAFAAYADFGLVNGVTYYYVVTSVTGGLESLNSNEASGTPAGRTRTR